MAAMWQPRGLSALSTSACPHCPHCPQKKRLDSYLVHLIKFRLIYDISPSSFIHLKERIQQRKYLVQWSNLGASLLPSISGIILHPNTVINSSDIISKSKIDLFGYFIPLRRENIIRESLLIFHLSPQYNSKILYVLSLYSYHRILLTSIYSLLTVNYYS